MDDDRNSDCESRSSAPVFSTCEQSATTATSVSDNENDTASMRSNSPAPSVMSMSSALRQALYKQEFGRNLNNYSNVYQLPADEEELDRLERQYDMLNSLFGYKYPPPMRKVLEEDNSKVQNAVLDLGSGAGNWIIDVARDFPHCEAVAVDLTPMKSKRIPSNLRSEVDDINLGLEHFTGQFNVVHTRLIAMGVQDYYRLIDQISDVLRPGGLIDLAEVDFVTYDRNHQLISVTDPTPDALTWGKPYWSHWLRAVSNVARDRLGGDVTAARHLYSWVSKHQAYEDVTYHEFWLPIIPGNYDRPPEEAEFLKEHRMALEYDVLSFLKAGRPMLLRAGYSEQFLLGIERHVFEELREAEEPQYARIETVYARKKHVVLPVVTALAS
ncbi:hypothetical protein AGABI1DRAFT_32801 [Agaricus bisporus var. burnettii JB137-S8]|uniref:Methyltransferase domain-containing protein n=1 Tax=Agaricus bisporus var. burnettii (strain JB137-S8 / ATCC MYA-4627 / FGSC 10392) TaxID=597362 RepID=K5Y702_AGABU|nr:uncharacterized protein AGABI1DRAFT_32801 [Agaricus bisporus var. burnettii JB137-S8]EKM83990.1 hypothetical protein AGABI1DRAFT_32801 [Agaricus bisporus var. burnettii JB137-S8]